MKIVRKHSKKELIKKNGNTGSEKNRLNLKIAGILAGATVGCALGGTISLAGKLAKKKTIDDIGESVVNSTILTGEIAGQAVSGAANLVGGAVARKPKKLKKGVFELKKTGGQVVDNFVQNFKLIAKEGSEILDGAKTGNTKKVKRSVKRLGKMLAVELMTVGALQMKEEEKDGSDPEQNESYKEAADEPDIVEYEPEWFRIYQTEYEMKKEE